MTNPKKFDNKSKKISSTNSKNLVDKSKKFCQQIKKIPSTNPSSSSSSSSIFFRKSNIHIHILDWCACALDGVTNGQGVSRSRKSFDKSDQKYFGKSDQELFNKYDQKLFDKSDQKLFDKSEMTQWRNASPGLVSGR